MNKFYFNVKGTSTADEILVTPKRPVQCPISIINYQEFETGVTRAINGIERLRDSRQPRINQLKEFLKRGSNTMFTETMRRYQRKSVSLTQQQRNNYAKTVETAIEKYKDIRNQFIKDLDAQVKGSGSEQSLMDLKDTLETTKLKLATTKTDLIVFPIQFCNEFNSKYAPVQSLFDEITLKAKNIVL